MKSFNRRDFLKSSVSAAAITALSRKKIIGANDKVVLGIMGVGGRGFQDNFNLLYVIHPSDIPHIKIKYDFSLSFGYILNEN